MIREVVDAWVGVYQFITLIEVDFDCESIRFRRSVNRQTRQKFSAHFE